jgi:hypothetical protein
MNNAAAKTTADRAKTLPLSAGSLDVEKAATVAWENAGLYLQRGESRDCYGEFIVWAKDVGLVGDCVPTMPYDLEPDAHAAWETWTSTSCWRNDGDEFRGE